MNDIHIDILPKHATYRLESAVEFSPAPSPGPTSLGLGVDSETKSSPSPAPEIGAAGLSARELNRLKRKRKPGNTGIVAASASKQGNVPPNKVRVVASHTDGHPEARPMPGAHEDRRKQELASPSVDGTVADRGAGGAVTIKENATKTVRALTVPEGAWVWQGVVDVLEVDLLSPNWEVRHGAALGLREVVKSQGTSGGMRVNLPAEQNLYEHERWCNDLAAKVLCIFALDRFGDFVSDSAVAPVRETASQSLASLLLHMPLRSVYHVHAILLDMVHQNFSSNDAREIFSKSSKQSRLERRIWEVMHAGLLGIKYEVAVRRDLIDPDHNGKEILKGVVDAAIIGLKDPNDDVQSEAASCLNPIVAELVQYLPEHLDVVLNILWDAFVDLKDDLGSSIAAVMELLGKLMSFNEVITVVVRDDAEHPLCARVSTLHPLFRHTLPSVRLSVVKTLQSFLDIPALTPDWITEPLLRLLFQNIVLEERSDIRNSTVQAWRASVQLLKSHSKLEDTAQAALQAWFELVSSPLGAPIDVSLLFSAAVNGRDSTSAYNVDKSMLAQDFSLISIDAVLQCRLAGAESLAFLMYEWSASSLDMTFLPLLDHYSKSPSALQRSMSAVILEEWARFSDMAVPPNGQATTSSLAAALGVQLLSILENGPLSSYYEMIPDLSRLRTECQPGRSSSARSPR